MPLKTTFDQVTLLPAASATSTDHHYKMASCLHFIVVLCLTSGLWSGANAQKEENPWYVPCKTCPSGWTLFEDHCYMYKHAAKTWADAEVDCIALGGNLASIPKLGVYTFIRQIINTATNANKPAWIGGTDLAKDGVWMWSDGTKFVTKLWGPGQPDNAGGQEHCLVMNWSGCLLPSGKWTIGEN